MVTADMGGGRVLEITTLGGVGIAVDGVPVQGLRSAKATALLIYLAETHRPHHRSSLSALLWPDRPEAGARNNLRQALTALRKVIPDHLSVEGDLVGLAGEVIVDTRPMTPETYRGPFLDGFSVGDSDLFETWVQRVRSGHELVALTVLTEGASAALNEGRVVDGLAIANRILEMEPWNEQGHRLIMRLLAVDGRVAEAVEQYDRCADALWEHIGVRPDAATDATLRAIEQSARAESAEGPARAPSVAVPSTSLVGRDTEIAELAAVLDGGERLVSLVGPGGIGKTRLAVALMDRVKSGYPDGTVAVSLEGVSQGDRVAPVIATACGLESLDDAADLGDRLAARSLLLLLDNAEQVADAVAEVVASVLRRAPKAAVLITSRSALNLGTGHVHWMDGLEASGLDSAAVELFMDRARRVVRDPAIDEHVVDVCRLLDGYPLAIELAARRMDTMRPADIAQSLTDGLGILSTSVPDVADRHRSMEAVLASAWDAMPAELADVMTALSVHRGGFDAAAASVVAGAGSRALQQLIGRSLLTQRADRYGMHELVRQYAATRAALDDAADRHARHYLEVLAESDVALFGGEARSAIAKLGRDFDNITAAWMYAMESDARLLIHRAAGSLYRLVHGSGRTTEGVSLLTAAADQFGGVLGAELIAYEVALTASGRPLAHTESRMGLALTHLGATDTEEAVRARVMLLDGYGQCLTEMAGDVFGSRAAFDEARDLLASLGDPDLDAHLRTAAVKTEVAAGNFGGALDLVEPALAHYEATGHLAGAAQAQSRIAMAYAEQGKVAQALSADLRALELFTTLGYQTRIADCQLNVGASYVLCGAWDQAEEMTLSARAIYEALGAERMLFPYIACQLAEVQSGRGNRDEAERLFVHGIAEIREKGFSLGLRLKLPEWGRFLVEDGRHVQAELVLDEAAEVWRAIGGDHFIATVDATRARALAGQGRSDDATSLALDVWERLRAGVLDRLPYPIETLVDLLMTLDPGGSSGRWADVRSVAVGKAKELAAAFVDPALRASFLALDDVGAVLRPSGMATEEAGPAAPRPESG